MNQPVSTGDGSFTLHSDRYDQTYHSTHGALTEAQHVFVEASGVGERLRNKLHTRVLEIGFGLGLNTLLTADLAAQSETLLEYHAFEHDLVGSEIIAGMHYGLLLHQPTLADKLCSAVAQARRQKPASVGQTYSSADDTQVHQQHYCAQTSTHALSPTVQLTLHLHDATKADMTEICGIGFHAVYLDAFSPDSNAECWSPDFIQGLADCLACNGRMSTYSAKGNVRRAMQAAGLKVDKLPGPPGKREMLLGHK